MRLRDLLIYAKLEIPENAPDCEINCIETNTKEAIDKKDSNIIFVCVSGANYDTHNDIEVLINSGIKYIVTEKDVDEKNIPKDVYLFHSDNTRKSLSHLSRAYYGFPDKSMSIIGVTGTKGKTTVTYMLESILKEAGINCGVIGTNGIFYNDTYTECENTTPSSPQYYSKLRDMANGGVKYVICEITSQSLKQSRTYGTEFDIAVFTNLYPDHIGKNEHKDFEEYRSCKGKLFEVCKRAVINSDDSSSEYFIKQCVLNNIPYVCFSQNNKCEKYFCRKHKLRQSDTIFYVNNNRFEISLPGNFNIQNAICAIAVAREIGIEYEQIKNGLSNAKVYGRCERVESPEGVNIIIDYAHNKESLENILIALKKECKGKLYCVFGAGGDRSKLRRSGMGQAALRCADYSIITNDNPRSENPDDIISDILEGMNGFVDKYTVVPKRENAINLALTLAKKGDTVLLAGKGAQNYEEIRGVKYPFDERVAVSKFYEKTYNKK